MKKNRSYKNYGDHALLMEFDPQMEQQELLQVIRLRNYLQKQFAHKLHDLVHSFSSICFIFKDHFDLPFYEQRIEKIILEGKWKEELFQLAHWEIPICFDPEFSSDLIAHFDGKQNKINAYKTVICHQSFTLGFYGFLPGFCYLAGLSQQMAIKRKAKPNRTTKKGSVAVGGQQLGIYPQDSPGAGRSSEVHRSIFLIPMQEKSVLPIPAISSALKQLAGNITINSKQYQITDYCL